MRYVANAYVQAFRQFAVMQVFIDAVKSLLLIGKLLAFILASVLWVVLAPLLALVEVVFPGSMDRTLLRLSR